MPNPHNVAFSGAAFLTAVLPLYPLFFWQVRRQAREHASVWKGRAVVQPSLVAPVACPFPQLFSHMLKQRSAQQKRAASS